MAPKTLWLPIRICKDGTNSAYRILFYITNCIYVEFCKSEGADDLQAESAVSTKLINSATPGSKLGKILSIYQLNSCSCNTVVNSNTPCSYC